MSRLGSPLSLSGRLTTPQTSLDATDRRFARLLSEPLSAGFDGRISPDAAAQLPGRWAATGTGLSPASPSWLIWTHSFRTAVASGRVDRSHSGIQCAKRRHGEEPADVHARAGAYWIPESTGFHAQTDHRPE